MINAYNNNTLTPSQNRSMWISFAFLIRNILTIHETLYLIVY